MRRHVSAGLADQVLLSAGSILVLLLGARAYSPEDLGAYSAGLVTFQMVTVILRSLTGETLIVLRQPDAAQRARSDHDCLQLALVLPVLGLPLAVLLACTGGDVLRAIAAGLAVSSAVCVQDTVRYVLLRRGDSERILRMDTLVVTSQVLLVAVLVARDVPPAVVVLVLGVPPGVAAARHWAVAGLRVSVGSAARWYRASRQLSTTYFYEAVLGAALQWVTFAAIAATASVGDAAAFRSLTAVFGLTNVVVNFLRGNVLAHMVASAADDDPGRQLRRQVVAMTSLVTGTIAVSTLVLVLLPDAVGRELLGQTWPLAQPFLLVGALSRLLTTLTVVPSVVLRAQQVTWRAATVRTSVGVLSLAVVPVAVSAGGVQGAFLATAATSLVMVLALAGLVSWRPDRARAG